MPKYTQSQSQFSLAEYNRLRREGKSIAEITQILGISKATLYRHLNAATKNAALSAIEQVEHYWDEYYDALSNMLNTDHIPAEDQETLRSDLKRLHLALVSNIADASKLAKQTEAYIKFSE